MIRQYDGRDLARVLMYYGLIGDVSVSEFNILCPLHDDKNTPSLKIDLTDGSFYCFGCGKSGNAYDFVRYANPKLNDLQCGVLLEQIIHSKEVGKIQCSFKRKKKQNSSQALIEAKDYYYGLRTIDWNNPIEPEHKAVLEYMQRRGFDARALNVVKCKPNDTNIAYPMIFPLYDNGVFKGWVGRTTNKYVESRRKYFYNKGFHKRTTLCGTYEQNAIVVICEGFMDYLSLKTRGHLHNVVAILGWHISEEQAKELHDKGVKCVISALDNDNAGKRGTEYLKRYFEVIRFQYPLGVKDAGDMNETQLKIAIKKTKQAMKGANSNGKN